MARGEVSGFYPRGTPGLWLLELDQVTGLIRVQNHFRAHTFFFILIA